MAWNVSIVDTITGRSRQRIEDLPSAFSWERVLNAGGSGQTTFMLGDRDAYAGIITPASTLPVAKTIVLSWEDKAVYAGIIWTRPYNRGTQQLTLTHSDIWSFFPLRHVLASNANDVGRTEIVIPPAGQPTLKLSSIAKTVVFEGQDAASSMYRLPIDFPADELGNFRRTYKGYELKTVQDALTELMSESGGPDIDFQPYWADGGTQLRYEMRVGSLRQGSWEWNMAADEASAFDASLTDDATKLSVNTFGIGLGSERKMNLRAGRNDDSPYPVLERRIEHKTIADPVRLDSLIAEDLRVHAEPTKQWGLSMQADGTPAVSDLRLGGTTRQYYADDPWIPDGWHENRLIQFSGDLTTTVNLGLQTLGGA